MNNDGILLTVREVAEVLGFGEGKVWKLITSGEIPSVAIPGFTKRAMVRVRREDLDRWLRTLPLRVTSDG